MALASAFCRASRDGFLRGARSVASTSSPVPETMSYLRDLRTGNEVFLVGTAHISRKSAEEVRSVIKSVKPDTVFLELCAARAAAMRSSTSRGSDEGIPEPVRQLLASFGCVRPTPAPGGAHSRPERFLPHPAQGRNLTPLAPFSLPTSQRPRRHGRETPRRGPEGNHQMLRQFHGLDPGLEFKVGMEEADRSGARLVLGDATKTPPSAPSEKLLTSATSSVSSPVRIAAETDTSGWIPSSRGVLRPRIGAIPSAPSSCSRQGGDVGADEADARAIPRVAAAMLDERDDIMTRRLLRECPGRTVAVVGMAHMDGIEERWRAAQGGDGGVTLISGS